MHSRPFRDRCERSHCVTGGALIGRLFSRHECSGKASSCGTGSEYIEGILNQPGSKGAVSRLSLVEMESVFSAEVATGVGESACWP